MAEEAARSVLLVLDARGFNAVGIESGMNAFALRVPVSNGSVTDLTVTTSRATTVQEVKDAYAEAAAGPYKGLLTYTDAPVVSSDIVGDPASCVFDSSRLLALHQATFPSLVVPFRF